MLSQEDLKKTSQLIDQRQPGQSDAASQKELEAHWSHGSFSRTECQGVLMKTHVFFLLARRPSLN